LALGAIVAFLFSKDGFRMVLVAARLVPLSDGGAGLAAGCMTILVQTGKAGGDSIEYPASPTAFVPTFLRRADWRSFSFRLMSVGDVIGLKTASKDNSTEE
jgi:hypothetical protein